MSATEVSIKWKERSGTQSACGINKRETTSTVCFTPMIFGSLSHDFLGSLPRTERVPPQYRRRRLLPKIRVLPHLIRYIRSAEVDVIYKDLQSACERKVIILGPDSQVVIRSVFDNLMQG